MSELGKGKLSAHLLKNPFEDIQKKGQEYSVKYCAWEVLKDYCQGLNVTQIAKEIQERGLKDFSEKKNAAGQVSGDLVRGKGVFWHDPERKLWWIRPLAPIFKGNRSKAYGTPATRNKKSSSGKEVMNGSSLVGLRATVWWDGEKAFFDGQIDAYDEVNDRFRIVYDDGDADESMAFHKYTIISKEGQLDTVKVLEHNLDDIDTIPGNHEVAVDDPTNDMLHFESLSIAAESNNTPGNEWKPAIHEMDVEHPASQNQGITFANLANPVMSSQEQLAQQAAVDRETVSKMPKKKAARVALEKNRAKRTGKPGRPPKRQKTQVDNDARNRKRPRSCGQEEEGEGLHLEAGPQLACAPVADPTEGAPAANFLGEEMHQPAREAAGSTCENNAASNVDETKAVKEEFDIPNALIKESPDCGKEGSMFDVSTPIAPRQAQSTANNEPNPSESEAIRTDDVSGCVILRRKRSVMNRRGLQPGSSRVWGGSSLESRSNTGDENQTQFEVADQSHNTSSQPSYKSAKSPGSGKSSRCASPESISCTMPNGGKSIGRKRSAYAKESTLLQLLTRDLSKNLERGASIDMLDLTKGLFTNPRVMEPPLGQLGNVGELMSLSQLSEELKPKQEELQSQAEAEVTSALLDADRHPIPSENNTNSVDLIADQTGCRLNEQDQKISSPFDDGDEHMDNLQLGEDPFRQKATCFQQDGVACSPVPVSVEDNLRICMSDNAARGRVENTLGCETRCPSDEAKRTQYDPGLHIIADPSSGPCKLSASGSSESKVNLAEGDHLSDDVPANPEGGITVVEKHHKIDDGCACPLSGDTNKPFQCDTSYARHSFPPMPIGVLKWSAPPLQTSSLKLPCPIDGLKKRFEDWPYPGFFPAESVSNMKNLSESGCRPG